LREGFWARIALVVVILSVAFVYLGRWQYGRHEGKVTRNVKIDTNYAATPVPVGDVLPATGSRLDPRREWTPVQVTGTYRPDATVVIRNRPLDGTYGFEVVVPFQLTSGTTLLVDRGWIPPGESTLRPDRIPAPPAGTVTVVARLRPGERRMGAGAPPAGQAESIELDRIAATAGGDVYRNAYGVLAHEDPAPATAPTQLPKPDEDLGPHLAYAYQWWAGALAGYVLLGVYAVREVRIRQQGGTETSPVPTIAEPAGAKPASAEPTTADAAGADATGAAAETAPHDPADADADATGIPAPRPAQPSMAGRLAAWRASRRREPTDEEWEDAANG
jgi:cytochrome oxidase assembly protein ShyY1